MRAIRATGVKKGSDGFSLASLSVRVGNFFARGTVISTALNDLEEDPAAPAPIGNRAIVVPVRKGNR